MTEAINNLKAQFKERLIVLAHYYQRDEVVSHADFVGDSYALAVKAGQSQAEFIVFCGVSFMAESARVLAQPEQRVFLPDKEAGCPLADMLTEAEFNKAYNELEKNLGQGIAPLLYINSSADVKAAVAEKGGLCCTSSNAKLLVRGLLEEGKTVFFLPDKNLGLNTAQALGLKQEEIGLYSRHQGLRNASPNLRIIVWDGFCNVHVRFKASDVLKAKNLYPYAKILVHPECSPDVVALADFSGSTSEIIKEAGKAGPGDVLFIGTELNLVKRLAQERPEVKIVPLRDSGCVNMNKITQAKLMATLNSLNTDKSSFLVTVPQDKIEGSRKALRRMIELVEARRKTNGQR